MQATPVQGLFKDKNKLFTENLPSSAGIQVYNEKLITLQNKEYRSWNPYRSKLAAALLKGLPPPKIHIDSSILYLGAATGTTVSHLSDIVKNGVVYAVESSPIAMKTFLQSTRQRPNIVPLLADANHPDHYASVINNPVDFLYQDISQRNQAEIFIKNMKQYLKTTGTALFMVKARSIDVALKPKQAYQRVIQELHQNGLKVHTILELAPYEKDHAVLAVSYE